jgi:hypothetical protein
MEQDTFWGVDPQPFEHLGVTQGEFYHFPDSMELRFQAANVFIGDCRCSLGSFLG